MSSSCYPIKVPKNHFCSDEWIENYLMGGGFKHFYFHPYLGKWSNLIIFHMGWFNHQLVFISRFLFKSVKFVFHLLLSGWVKSMHFDPKICTVLTFWILLKPTTHRRWSFFHDSMIETNPWKMSFTLSESYTASSPPTQPTNQPTNHDIQSVPTEATFAFQCFQWELGCCCTVSRSPLPRWEVQKPTHPHGRIQGDRSSPWED